MMRRTVCTLILVLCTAGGARAQIPGTDPPSNKNLVMPPRSSAPATSLEFSPTDPGIGGRPDVGDPAPDFDLAGSLGWPVHLGDLKGEWILLVFAGDRTSLGSLRQIYGEMRMRGVHVYGVSGDGALALESYAQSGRLPFVLLSDVSREVSRLYGMVDPVDDAIESGLVLIDPEGIVRLSLPGHPIDPQDVLATVVPAATGV